MAVLMAAAVLANICQAHLPGRACCPAAGAEALTQQLAGGMRMALTPAELEAKQRVQLPFEHQGQVGWWLTRAPRACMQQEQPVGARRCCAASAAYACVHSPSEPPLPPLLCRLQGAAYQTGDFRDYLPPEAGGRARPPSAGAARPPSAAAAPGEQQRLGHILYVRDSGSEHDSGAAASWRRGLAATLGMVVFCSGGRVLQLSALHLQTCLLPSCCR